MKKTTLIAAAAALLLSGGVFMKANQKANFVVDALIENIKASTEDGEAGANPIRDREQRYAYCTIHVFNFPGTQIKTIDWKLIDKLIAMGYSYTHEVGLVADCYKKSKGSTCYEFPCSVRE